MTTKTIKPHGGGDYTTLIAALAGEVATTGDLVLICFAGNVNDVNTPEAHIPTSPPGAYSSLTIKVDPSAYHGGNPTKDPATCATLGVALGMGANEIDLQAVTIPVVIDGFLLVSNSTITAQFGTVGPATLRNLILTEASIIGATGASDTDPTPISITIENCIITGESTIQCTASAIGVNASSTVNLKGVTAYNDQTPPIQISAYAEAGKTATATLNAVNCIGLFGNTEPGNGYTDGIAILEVQYGGGGTEATLVNLSHCCKDAANPVSGTNTAGVNSTPANTWTDLAHFILKPTSNCLKAGLDGGGPATDVAGKLRPSTATDIGAVQLTDPSPLSARVRALAFCGESS